MDLAHTPELVAHDMHNVRPGCRRPDGGAERREVHGYRQSGVAGQCSQVQEWPLAWYSPTHRMITRTRGRVEAILPANQWLIVHTAAGNKQRASVFERESGRFVRELVTADSIGHCELHRPPERVGEASPVRRRGHQRQGLGYG